MLLWMLADCSKLNFPSHRCAKVHSCIRNLKILPVLFNNCNSTLMQRSLTALGAAQAVFLGKKKTTAWWKKPTEWDIVHIRIVLRSSCFNKKQNIFFHWMLHQMLKGENRQSCTSLLQHARQQHTAQQCPKPAAFSFKCILILRQWNKREGVYTPLGWHHHKPLLH